MKQPTNLSLRLKQATQRAHDSLDRLPYPARLRSGEAPDDSVVGHLRALAIVHAALDDALAKASMTNGLEYLGRCGTPRLPGLIQDLARFPPWQYRDIYPAIRAAIELAGRIRRRAVTNPASLAGYVYVLEGSRLGALSVATAVDRALRVDSHDGLGYFRGLGPATAAHWDNTTGLLDTEVVDEDVQRSAIDAAREAFEGFHAIFHALFPFSSEDLCFTSAAINPESGDHPVPRDGSVIRAAIEAGNRCLEQFPYLTARYGERGVRFTHSDSAWLATLDRLDRQAAAGRVKWLAAVLANRGMPSRLLQVHLDVLHEELTRRTHPGEQDYGVLASCARELSDAHSRFVSDSRLKQLNEEFEQWVGRTWAEKMRNTGQLIVSSAVDLMSGITKSNESFRNWICDPSRFPRVWIQSVDRLYARLS